MKKIVLLLCVLVGVNGLSQTAIIDDNIVYKKGLYKDFDELKFNNPSLPLNYVIDTVEYTNVDLLNNPISHKVYRLKIDNKEAKSLGSITGFCDGRHIYINEYNKAFSDKLDFEQLQFVGLYSYFETYMFMPGELGAPNSSMITGKILNSNNGEIIDITKNTLHSIFENDSLLLSQFEKEENKQLKIKDFISIYSLKHKTDGVFCRDKKMTFQEANSFIERTEQDISDRVYYARLLHTLQVNPAFSDATLDEKFYENGKRKSIGINTRCNFDPNDQFLYCVGLWKLFYDTGNIKEEIFYSITSKQLSRKRYDKNGTLIDIKN